MIDLDKIFEDFDEEEFNEPEWGVIKIHGTYYITIEEVYKKNGYDYKLHDNYTFHSPIKINPIKNIDKEWTILYNFNNPNTKHCKVKNLPNDIREKLGLRKSPFFGHDHKFVDHGDYEKCICGERRWFGIW